MSLTLERTSIDTAPRSRGDAALKIIEAFKPEVDDRFRVEPLATEFPSLAEELGGNVWLARAGDNLAGTFKWRGAMYAAHALKQAGYERLAIASAGNAARGAALAAKALDLWLHVVVPTTAPTDKSEGVIDLWPDGKLSLTKHGRSFDEASLYLARNPGFGQPIPAFDSLDVMAGQGTLVDDILRQLADTRHIVGSIGGGSLTGGILTRLNEIERNDVSVYAVEAPGSNSASRSLESGRLELADSPNRRYGGAAVRQLGVHTFRAIQLASNFDAIKGVTDSDIDRIIASYIYDRRINLVQDVTPYEPTTLVALGGLVQVVDSLRRAGRDDEAVVVVGTGHNAPLAPEVATNDIHQLLSWQK